MDGDRIIRHDRSAAAVEPSASDGPTASDRTVLFRDLTARMARLIEASTVWVVEDVHWANEDTVELLGDLDADEVTELLHAEGIADAPDLGAQVGSRTGGNPFFIHELARTADADGRMDPGGLPDTLRSWIDQRVASLGDGPEEVLAAAAVLGTDVDLDLHAAAADAIVAGRALARSALAEAHPLAEAFGHPYWQWVVRTWQTLELVGDRDAAVTLQHLLLPHRDRQVVLNCFGGGGSYWGPVATQLGRLSLVLGDEEGTTAHLAAARASAEAFEAPLAARRIP